MQPIRRRGARQSRSLASAAGPTHISRDCAGTTGSADSLDLPYFGECCVYFPRAHPSSAAAVAQSRLEAATSSGLHTSPERRCISKARLPRPRLPRLVQNRGSRHRGFLDPLVPQRKGGNASQALPGRVAGPGYFAFAELKPATGREKCALDRVAGPSGSRRGPGVCARPRSCGFGVGLVSARTRWHEVLLARLFSSSMVSLRLHGDQHRASATARAAPSWSSCASASSARARGIRRLRGAVRRQRRGLLRSRRAAAFDALELIWTRASCSGSACCTRS